MKEKLSEIYNKVANFDVSDWVHRNPAKVSNAILIPGEFSMMAGGALTLNPLRVWTGVQGMKAAVGGYIDGDTKYNTAESHPLLKANPSFVAGGVSDWSSWADGNVRQYGTLTSSGQVDNPFDMLLSLPGLAAFKALTIANPARQVHEISSKLDSIAFKPENNHPIQSGTFSALKGTFNAPYNLLQTLKTDIVDFGGFLKNHGPVFLSALPGAFKDSAIQFKDYMSSGKDGIGKDLKDWATNFNSLESVTFKEASMAKKFLYSVPFALNDTAEKLTDVIMLPFKATFKALSKPVEPIAQAITDYGIARDIDGKKTISEKLQNYSELPYTLGSLGFLVNALAHDHSSIGMAALMATTGASYFISNSFQRKSGNVPGMDLDLPVYLHKASDIDSKTLHGISSDIPGYHELVDAIKVVLFSEKDYIAKLEKLAKTNPEEIYETETDGKLALDSGELKKWLDANPHVAWERNESGEYNLENAGFVKPKEQYNKISIAQIVGLPDLRHWPENALPAEAEDVIKRANKIRQRYGNTVQSPEEGWGSLVTSFSKILPNHQGWSIYKGDKIPILRNSVDEDDYTLEI